MLPAVLIFRIKNLSTCLFSFCASRSFSRYIADVFITSSRPHRQGVCHLSRAHFAFLVGLTSTCRGTAEKENTIHKQQMRNVQDEHSKLPQNPSHVEKQLKRDSAIYVYVIYVCMMYPRQMYSMHVYMIYIYTYIYMYKTYIYIYLYIYIKSNVSEECPYRCLVMLSCRLLLSFVYGVEHVFILMVSPFASAVVRPLFVVPRTSHHLEWSRSKVILLRICSIYIYTYMYIYIIYIHTLNTSA